jgi:hypothetical protein
MDSFGRLASKVVDALHSVRVVADAGDFQRLFRSNENHRAICHAPVDVFERFVVPGVPRFERAVDRRVVARRFASFGLRLNYGFGKISS